MNGFQFDCRKLFSMAQIRELMCLALLAGCGGNVPVKVDVARKTLASTMESWKEGKTPEDLRKRSPSIVVQETEWTNGAKLLEYEILDGDKPVDANLIARVKLKLSGADGKEITKTATYVVGTSPVLTVFRDLMK